MDNALKAAIIKARALQLYYHYCHNLVTGCAFHSDHSFFGASYAALEGSYDSLVEYFIAIYGNSVFSTKEITELTCDELEDLEMNSMSAEGMYQLAVTFEQDFQMYLVDVNQVARLGLQNAVQGMATESDVRLYKIRQRLAGK